MALGTEVPAISESNSSSVVSASPSDFLRVAYKKSSFLSSPSPKYAYNPLSMDETVDIEMGELTLPTKSNSIGIADIEHLDGINDANTGHSLLISHTVDSSIDTTLSCESTDSPDSVQELAAHNVPIVRVISAHNMKSTYSPVRQRSVTVDSSPSALQSAILLHKHKNVLLRRNQNSFNA